MSAVRRGERKTCRCTPPSPGKRPPRMRSSLRLTGRPASSKRRPASCCRPPSLKRRPASCCRQSRHPCGHPFAAWTSLGPAHHKRPPRKRARRRVLGVSRRKSTTKASARRGKSFLSLHVVDKLPAMRGRRNGANRDARSPPACEDVNELAPLVSLRMWSPAPSAARDPTRKGDCMAPVSPQGSQPQQSITDEGGFRGRSLQRRQRQE